MCFFLDGLELFYAAPYVLRGRRRYSEQIGNNREAKHLFDVCQHGDLCLEISCLCFVHGKCFFVFDGGGPHCRDVALDSLGTLDNPASGSLYAVQEEGSIRVQVFFFQDDVCFFDLEGFDVLYDGLGCLFGGHEMGGYSGVFCAELFALWLVFRALGPETLLKRGRGCVEHGAYLSVLSLC